MNISRSFAAPGSWLLIKLIVAPTLLFVYFFAQYKRHGNDVTDPVMAGLATVGSATSITVGIPTAFLMGWWRSTGLSEGWIAQGVLIGAMITLLGLTLDFLIGGIAAAAWTWVLDGGSAVLGAAFARHRALGRNP